MGTEQIIYDYELAYKNTRGESFNFGATKLRSLGAELDKYTFLNKWRAFIDFVIRTGIQFKMLRACRSTLNSLKWNLEEIEGRKERPKWLVRYLGKRDLGRDKVLDDH
ncbi:hypothetical protein NPIL_32731 [Nephila pilipes]|uniref:Uncharacterized protein n=1 Tax=Nephila pilipes TaxID=299642 RepID=A0A8X6N8U7_NEPPI|nr:hypothetical protein NPIL_32731 [Nephila pilipes]